MKIYTTDKTILSLVDTINASIIDINYFGSKILKAKNFSNCTPDKADIKDYVVAVRKYNTAVTYLNCKTDALPNLSLANYNMSQTVYKLQPIWVETKLNSEETINEN